MRFLLRPGWLAFIAVVVAFVLACYTLLAPWQFGREAERDAQQQAIESASAIAPVPLAELLSPTGVDRDVQWRQVEVTGTYLPDGEALVRLRVVDGKPAFEVLTPFRTDSGTLITLNRGSVAAPDGQVVPIFAAPPTGPVTLTGQLRVDQADPEDRPAFTAKGHRQVYAADSRTLAASTGLDLVAGHLQLATGQPGVLDPIPVTPSTGGAPFTNLSYALQWLTFGAIALFAMVYFVRLELLQRRPSDRSELRRALSGD
ncbi:MAG: SURF1 family cytochrome oxidase biogenesis protein [Pseudonocardia sp.]